VCIVCTKKENKNKHKPIVYQIVHVNSNRIYIGQTIVPINKRISKHFSTAKIKAEYPLHIEMEKESFNKNAFYWEVLEETTQQELDKCEQKWIEKALKEGAILYNIETGGKTGYSLPDSSRKKMSEARKNFKPTKEQLEKAKQTKIKNGTWRISNPVSEETKKKISEAHMGKEGQKGSKNSMAKINENDVLEIIKLLIDRKKPKEIQEIIGINSKTISAINRRKIWKHVTIEGYEDVDVYYNIRKRNVCTHGED